jgi:hypothetical protein
MPPLTWPYVHTLINHFPIVLSAMGTIGALIALIRKKRGIWLYTMATMTAAGLAIGPVYLTGDEAADTLHQPWFVLPGAIKEHNAAANFALAALLITGAICAYSWWRALRYRDEPIPAFIRGAVVISTLFSFSVVARTAYLGGEIIHEAPVLKLPSAPAGMAPTPHYQQ